MNNAINMANMILQNNQITNNPMVQNAIRLKEANDVQGLQTMAENLCRERGIDINEMKNRIRNM